jgi:hypothetical protein
MYGLQYSMLPPHRVGVGEVWKALTGDDAIKSKTAQVWPTQNGRARTWGNGSAVGKRWK